MKWFGKIAFADQVDDGTGIWENKIVERDYFGDILQNSKRNQVTEINQDITVTNQLSVIADPYLLDSFHKILYVTFMGSKWRVSEVQVGYPRLTLSFGSLYNEEETNEDP